jgi:hypothetical protein
MLRYASTAESIGFGKLSGFVGFNKLKMLKVLEYGKMRRRSIIIYIRNKDDKMTLKP